MNTQIASLWPNLSQPNNPDGLDYDKCAQDPQFKANSGPYQGYFQLETNTWQYRIDQNDTGFTDFFAVGDWTRTTFPCGSVEGAIESGLTCGELIAKQYL